MSSDIPFPVYSGAHYYRRQYGNGFLDILPKIGRWLLPIAASGLGAFFSSAAKGVEEGQTFKEAAKSGLQEGLKGGVTKFKHKIGYETQDGTQDGTMAGTQAGSGLRKRKSGAPLYKRIKRSKLGHYNF